MTSSLRSQVSGSRSDISGKPHPLFLFCSFRQLTDQNNTGLPEIFPECSSSVHFPKKIFLYFVFWHCPGFQGNIHTLPEAYTSSKTTKFFKLKLPKLKFSCCNSDKNTVIRSLIQFVKHLSTTSGYADKTWTSY